MQIHNRMSGTVARQTKYCHKEYVDLWLCVHKMLWHNNKTSIESKERERKKNAD